MIVTAAILEKDGKILIARRKKDSHQELKWEFPGGKIEEGETPEECLARELYEEFRIKTSIGAFYCESEYDYSEHHVKLLAYKIDRFSGDFHLDSHDEIKWVDRCEMDCYDFAEADKPIVRRLIKDVEKIV